MDISFFLRYNKAIRFIDVSLKRGQWIYLLEQRGPRILTTQLTRGGQSNERIEQIRRETYWDAVEEETTHLYATAAWLT